jgi:hypothetical protein
MKYHRPEIIRVANPTQAIQGSTCKTGIVQDSHPAEMGYPTPVTSAAYEADE